MKLIVGLGNPGEKYKNTRHNAGFLALDFILNDGDGFMEAKPSHEFKSEMFTCRQGARKAIFLKPQTYMNDSGQALKIICNFYKIDLLKTCWSSTMTSICRLAKSALRNLFGRRPQWRAKHY